VRQHPLSESIQGTTPLKGVYTVVNLIGKEIRAYRLELLLGSGSSAQVYLGRHQQNRSYVAIKIVHNPTESEWMERWSNENRILSSLSHPHVIRMFEFGIQDTLPFRITNWAGWGTLRDLFSQRVSLLEVAHAVKQVASALQYLHSMHLIHRDVKPTNILFLRLFSISTSTTTSCASSSC
jgi:serine/threonine protein kinase